MKAAKYEFLLKYMTNEQPNFMEIDCNSVASSDNIPLVKIEPMLSFDDVDAETSSLESNEVFDKTPPNSIDHHDVGDFSNDGIDTDDDGSEYDPMADKVNAEMVTRKSTGGEIKVVSTAKMKRKPDLIPQYLNMICAVCEPEHPFERISELRTHYRNEHNFRNYIKVKCCQRRLLTTFKQIREHIQYHLHPNKFR